MYEMIEEIKRRERLEGFIDGRKKGRDEGIVIAMKMLMRNQGYTLGKAMNVLGIPINERQHYLYYLVL